MADWYFTMNCCLFLYLGTIPAGQWDEGILRTQLFFQLRRMAQHCNKVHCFYYDLEKDTNKPPT